MKAVSRLIEALIAGGMSAVDAAALVARAGAEMVAKQPSKAAERTRRWRANQRHKSSQIVTETTPLASDENSHKASPVTVRDATILTNTFFLSSELESHKKENKKESLSENGKRHGDDWPPDYVDQFWRQCPRRVAKTAAMKALEKVRKSGVSWPVLLAGVVRWSSEAINSDPKYVKHPATWLNAGCWDDEPAGAAPRRKSFMDVAMGRG